MMIVAVMKTWGAKKHLVTKFKRGETGVKKKRGEAGKRRETRRKKKHMQCLLYVW